MKKLLLCLLLATLAMPLACQKAPPELKQGMDVIGYMLAPRHMKRSAFSAAFPNGKPSQFVSFLFSDMGAAEWPAAEDAVTDMEREQMKAIRAPMAPAGVAYVPRRVDPTRGKQVVITFDDERGMVIAEAYVDPLAEPVLVREWKLPHVKPGRGVADMHRSNADLGAGDQSF